MSVSPLLLYTHAYEIHELETQSLWIAIHRGLFAPPVYDELLVAFELDILFAICTVSW